MNDSSTVTHGLAAAGLLVLTAGACLSADIDARGFDRETAVVRALAPTQFTRVGMGEPLTIQGLPIPEGRVDLELERFDVWAPGAVFLIDDNEAEKPGVVLLRGAVAGDPSSSVVIGIGEFATNGYIQTASKLYSISTGAYTGGAPGEVMIADIDEFKFKIGGPECGLDNHNVAVFTPPGLPAVPVKVAEHDTRGPAPCRVARIAIDTDWEWTLNNFGGNASASAEYAVFLMAAVSEVFQRDLNVRLVLPFLRTFSGNTDPYTGTDSPDPLDQVLDHWRAAMGHIEREAVHLLTGVNTWYGGIAYVNALCWNDWHFGVSAYTGGSFPYPLQMNSHNNWDLFVVAHELGHNFGTLHTHDGYTPPIDNCGIDCSGSVNGTIMSYCHGCSGGMMNVDLRFHPVVQARIHEFLANEAPCNLVVSDVANNDSATTFATLPVDIYVLANDSGPNCSAVGIQSVQSPTPLGANVSIVGYTNPTGDPTGHFLRYVAPPGTSGLDMFTYTTTSGQTATVSVDVVPLRQADLVTMPSPGLLAAWYDIGPTSSMPDFDLLTPIQTGIVPDLNFPSTNGNAVGGPLADEVGAVFRGYVVVPDPGIYTFSLESDDGSMLYVGDELVVNNDGLHGMQTASGQIGLEQGSHEIRVEYFENQGGAGLIYRWAGPGVSGVVPASALLHQIPTCGIADLAEPFGVLDLADINLFVLGFMWQHDSVDFAEPFGIWDLADIIAFLEAFNNGCE